MSDEQDKMLWDTAVFGKQVEEFMRSNVGQYIMAKAQRDYLEAVRHLRDCTTDELVQFQSDMKRAESIQGWFVSAIEEGLRALNVIEGKEDEESE